MRLRVGLQKPPIIHDYITDHKKQGKSSSRIWLRDNDFLLLKFLELTFHPNDHEEVKHWFNDEPKMAKLLITDFFKKNSEKILRVVNEFKKGKSKIAVVTGGRGSGKSAFAFWLSEYLKEERQIWVVGEENKFMPKWFNFCQDVKDTPRGSLVIMDEAGIQMSAREFQHKGHLQLTKMLTVLRHDNKSIMFITQHTALSDVNLVRLADCIFYKKQSSFQAVSERKMYNQKHVSQLILNLMPGKREETLFVGQTIMKFEHGLANFWNDRISKSWTDMGKRLHDEEMKRIEKIKKKEKEQGVMYI